MAAAPVGLADALKDRYRLDRELGQGGMATVYLAEDLKHHRQVALKVLRPELAAAIGAGRFLKEIETTASLQHPHVLPLFDSGSFAEHEGGAVLRPYYVMPYVEGESLRDRLTRERQLPLDVALRLTREVADALDYAHRHGVIHRDIKPENILLHEGRALVADFGIALAVEQAGGSRFTETGISLGTPHYMSPEQAAGDRVLDARSDIYSLACVLYEMLAGEPPFTGPTLQAITAKKLGDTAPSLLRARDTVSPELDAVIHTALARVPADRYATCREFVEALEHPAAAQRQTSSASAAPRWQRLAPWVLAAGLAVVAIAQRFRGGTDAGTGAVMHLSVTTPRNTEIYGMNQAFELSPDGSTLVFVAGRNDSTRLYARRLDDFTARPLPGTEGGDAPFFSPDGRWVGFFARRERQMKKVALAGGAPLLIAEDLGVRAGYGLWGQNDTIYFTNWPDIQLSKVAATGGAVGAVTHGPPPDGWFRFPLALFPGGRHALVVVFGMAGGHVDVVSLETGHHQLVLKDAVDARLMNDGHLLYIPRRHTEVLAVAFDLATMKVTGDPVTVLDSVAMFPDGSLGYFSVSQGGTLAYAPLSEWAEIPLRDLALVDRNGIAESIKLPAGNGPRFSPDGSRLVYMRRGRKGPPGVSVYDLARRAEILISPYERKGYDGWPIFSADGRRVLFNSDLGGSDFLRLYSAPADGSGTPAPLATDTIMHQQPFTWTEDGKDLLYTEGPGPNGMDIWTVPGDGSGAARPLMHGPANETQPALSPDGKWLAWVTDASGRLEVMVRRYPDGPDVPVSRDGGAEPVWGPGGRELYFRDLAGTQLLVASFHSGEPPAVDEPRVLFSGRYVRCFVWCRNFDISPDGRRFVMVKAWDRLTLSGYWPMGTEIRIVPHWDRELRAKLDAAGSQR